MLPHPVYNVLLLSIIFKVISKVNFCTSGTRSLMMVNTSPDLLYYQVVITADIFLMINIGILRSLLFKKKKIRLAYRSGNLQFINISTEDGFHLLGICCSSFSVHFQRWCHTHCLTPLHPLSCSYFLLFIFLSSVISRMSCSGKVSNTEQIFHNPRHLIILCPCKLCLKLLMS